ncbi:MAG: condensation domain-containing protein [Pseudomonadota bacterium]
MNSMTLPCSHHQLRWLEHEESTSSSYAKHNIPFIMRRHGPLDIEKLRQSMQTIIAKNDALQLAIYKHEGKLHQRIHSIETVHINEYHLPDSSVEDYCHLLRKLTSESIPYDKPPLLRANVVWHSEACQTIVIVISHMIADAESAIILMRMLQQCYHSGDIKTEENYLASYSDYIKYDTTRHFHTDYSAKINFWTNYLKNYRPLRTLYDSKKLHKKNDYTFFDFDKKTILKLRQQKHKLKCSIFEYLLAAFVLSCSTILNQDDISFFLPVSERRTRYFFKKIGFLSGPILFRAKVEKNLTVREWIDNIRGNVQSVVNNFLPVRLIENKFRKRYNTSIMSNVMLSWINLKYAQLKTIDGIKYEFPREIIGAGNNMGMPLFISFFYYNHSVRLQIDYNAQIYNAQVIEKWMDTYNRILLEMLATQEQTLADITDKITATLASKSA